MKRSRRNVDMVMLCQDVRDYMSTRGDADNLDVCHAMADKHGLWVPDHLPGVGDGDAFPIWLSRVCDGIMRDLREGIVSD
jgi:hypothetical protein